MSSATPLPAEGTACTSTADAPLDFRVLSGNPTAIELAAVTAVLTSMIEELETTRQLSKVRGQSAWQRSQRSIRAQLSPGYGAWRSFSG
ncbi:MAG: acyl-CoA carboxylase subunit epsilon [Lacisediminihabitans sp.]